MQLVAAGRARRGAAGKQRQGPQVPVELRPDVAPERTELQRGHRARLAQACMRAACAQHDILRQFEPGDAHRGAPQGRAAPDRLRDAQRGERLAIFRRGAVQLVVRAARRRYARHVGGRVASPRETGGHALLGRLRIGGEGMASCVEGVPDPLGAPRGDRRRHRAQLYLRDYDVQQVAEAACERQARVGAGQAVEALPVAAGIAVEQPRVRTGAELH